jgi:hypothetical protein
MSTTGNKLVIFIILILFAAWLLISCSSKSSLVETRIPEELLMTSTPVMSQQPEEAAPSEVPYPPPSTPPERFSPYPPPEGGESPDAVIATPEPTIVPITETPYPTPRIAELAVTDSVTQSQNLELVSYVPLRLPLDVGVVGNYAYIADGYDGFTVVYIEKILHGRESGQRRAPGLAKMMSPRFNGAALPGSGDTAYRLTISGDSAYVVGDRGLQIWDLAYPSRPVLIGQYATRGDDLAVMGDFAYVVAGFEGLKVIDVSDPANPIQVGAYDSPGYAQGLAVFDQYALVADGFSLRVVSLSNPRAPTEIGSYGLPGMTWDITVVDKHAYVAWNWRSTQKAGCIDCERGVSFFEILSGGRLVEVGGYQIPTGEITDTAISGRYALVTAGWSGLRVVDVSDLDHATEVGYFQTPGEAYAVTVVGDLIFMVDMAGLYVLEFTPESD